MENLRRALKIKVYQALLRPVVLYGSEANEKLSRSCVSGTVKCSAVCTIYGLSCGEVAKATGYISYMTTIIGLPMILAITKLNRMRWVSYVQRMNVSRRPKRILNT